MKLYCFGESGHSYKAALALQLSEIDWKPIFVDFFNGETRSEQYRNQINEMGEAPVLVDGDTLKKIKDSNQIIFKYCNQNGEVNNETNPNGSIENIAGITNEQGNVLGMMPHPERATCEITKLSDGENLFKSISEFLV